MVDRKDFRHMLKKINICKFTIIISKDDIVFSLVINLVV
jgi:hypothetical protein